MRAAVKSHFHSFLGIVAIGFIVHYLYRHPLALNSLNKLAVGIILLLCALHIMAQFIQTFLGWYLIKSGGAHISYHHYFWINGFSMLCNYLPLQGSIFVRGGLLSTRYNISTELYVTLIAFTFLLSQSLYSFVGSIAILVSGLSTGMFLLLLSISILSLSPLFSFSHAILPKLIKDKMQNFTLIKLMNIKVIVPISIAMLVGFLLLSIRYFLLFNSLTYGVNLISCFILACASGLSTLLRLTPAGLGIREGLTGLFAYGINLDVTVTVLVVIVDRIISLLIIIPAGLTSWYKIRSEA